MIAVNGKGGTGKTTIAALIMAYLVERKKGSILAIDADPNSCFAGSLGVREPQTIVGVCEEISKNMDRIPAGMTKDRFIEMRVQESLAEEDGFDLLAMGRPEGPGCYCYINNLLRDLIGRITGSYDLVVIDNAAGMEHISRRTMGSINRLLLVSDYSVSGIRSTKRIYDLAKELKIKIDSAFLVVNRVDGDMSAISDEVDKTGLEVAGELPYSEKLVDWNLTDTPVFEFKDSLIIKRIGAIVERLIGS